MTFPLRFAQQGGYSWREQCAKAVCVLEAAPPYLAVGSRFAKLKKNAHQKLQPAS
jgi:hypothetical protein